MFVSSLFFAAMSLLSCLSQNVLGLPHNVAVTVRGFVQCVMAFGLFLLSGDRGTFVSSVRKDPGGLLSVGVAGGFTFALHTLALGLLDVGDATAIMFVGPGLTFLFAYLLMGEPVTIMDVGALSLSLSGALFVAQGSRDGVYDEGDLFIGGMPRHLTGLAAACAASVCASMMTVLLRRLANRVPPILSVASIGFVTFFLGSLAGGLFNPLDPSEAARPGLPSMVLSGALGFGALCLVAVGLRHCNAGRGALIRNLDVPLLYFCGYIFLGELPGMAQIAGGILVVLGAILVATFRDS